MVRLLALHAPVVEPGPGPGRQLELVQLLYHEGVRVAGHQGAVARTEPPEGLLLRPPGPPALYQGTCGHQDPRLYIKI